MSGEGDKSDWLEKLNSFGVTRVNRVKPRDLNAQIEFGEIVFLCHVGIHVRHMYICYMKKNNARGFKLNKKGEMVFMATPRICSS